MNWCEKYKRVVENCQAESIRGVYRFGRAAFAGPMNDPSEKATILRTEE